MSSQEEDVSNVSKAMGTLLSRNSFSELEHEAANKISSTFKMLRTRKNFLNYIHEKGNYLAATMIQKLVRGVLTRKKLVPLIDEIKKDLGSLKTQEDLYISGFEIKTDKLTADLIGKNDFQKKIDSIFGEDVDSPQREFPSPNLQTVGKVQRVFSDKKNYYPQNEDLFSKQSKVQIHTGN